jgi:hypothetical protein
MEIKNPFFLASITLANAALYVMMKGVGLSGDENHLLLDLYSNTNDTALFMVIAATLPYVQERVRQGVIQGVCICLSILTIAVTISFVQEQMVTPSWHGLAYLVSVSLSVQCLLAGHCFYDLQNSIHVAEVHQPPLHGILIWPISESLWE